MMAGLFSRLFRSAPQQGNNGLRSPSQPEQRDASQNFADAFGLPLDVHSSFYVPPRMAENLAAVVACVNAISSGLASLPAYVYQRSDAGRTEAPSHPVSRLIRQPNQWQTWPSFLEWLTASTLLTGNGIAVIEWDGAGRPTALVPVPWNQVQVQLLRSGRLAYDVVAYSGPFGQMSMPRRYLQDEVLHIRDRSDDGLIGRSRLSRSSEVFTNAHELQSFALYAWRNQLTPNGAIEIEQSLTTEQYERIRARIDNRYSGSHNARRALILDNAAKWSSIWLSPEDAEILQSRKFTVEELARIYAVPPPVIGSLEYGTFTNSREMVKLFASQTLTAWARKIEAEFAKSLLSPTYELEIDLSGLLRGDPEQRWAAWKIALETGALTINEIRDIEGYGPLRSAPLGPVQSGEGGAAGPRQDMNSRPVAESADAN